MFETRIHGRGGQGVVTSAELLAVAAFREGHHAQAFPSFGSERTGAPVVSFCRIDHGTEIRTHEPISAPDAVIVVDPTLLHHVDVFGGLKPSSYVLINSSRGIDELGIGELRESHSAVLCAVPATEIAREFLGRPLPNAALLGAFAALTGIVSIESVAAAIHQRFGGEVAVANVRAAYAAAELVPPSSGKAAQEQTFNGKAPRAEVPHA